MRAPAVAALALALVAHASPLVIDPAHANGGKAKRVVYRGALPAAQGGGQEIQFDVEIEPLLFRLGAVRSRYRVVRIRLRNTGTRPLVLSATADTVAVQLRGGATLTGLLDLGARDATVWDGLPADLRSVIVYPRSVPGGEEENVFVFLPGAEVVDPPLAFRYTIASRPDRPVVIRDVSAAVGR